MYDPLPEKTKGPVVGFKLSQEITGQDLESIRQSVGDIIEETGYVRLFVEFEGLPTPTMGTIETDVKFLLKNRHYFDRVVVIGDHRFLKWTLKLIDHLTTVELQWFPTSKRQEAWGWIQPQ